MSAPSPVTTRRVPPPCWTPDETLVLVKSYLDRWLSLNRGYLRTSDWDAVSSAVSASNPGPPKSSLQCRHKIEKLRIRYRSEKQRCLALPGRFVSSWDLFPLLDSMNFGSSSTVNQVHDTGVRVKIVRDTHLTSKFRKVDDPNFNQDCDSTSRDGLLRSYDHNMNFDDDNLLNMESRANDYVKIDADDHRDFEVGFGVKIPRYRNYVSQGVRLNSYGKIDDVDFDCNIHSFPVKTLGDRILAPPPGFKPRNYSKIDENFYPNPCYDHEYEANNGRRSGFSAKTSDRGFVSSELRLKKYDRVDGNYNGNLDSWIMNGYASSSRLRFGKKNDGGGAKRALDLDPFEELVSSITLLTERFVKVEEMKMEMAMEAQKMRMEMEMKHSQMILESQQHILDTFLTGLLGKKKKKKKVKMELVSPNRTRNGDEV